MSKDNLTPLPEPSLHKGKHESKAILGPKVFCVGCNKTGTKSLKVAMEELGYRFNDHVTAARLAVDFWPLRDFRPLVEYCKEADAFQDRPFGYPYTYQAMDSAFPGSKFILTVRESADVWYEDLILYHGKIFGNGRVPPTKEDLQETNKWLYKGRPWQMNRLLFDTPQDEPYRRENLIAYYNNHVRAVKEYFRHRPRDLLVIFVGEPGAFPTLCRFLEKPPIDRPFPHVHRT